MRSPAVNKRTRQELAKRAVYVGCQFCGETDMSLRTYGAGKICSACMKKMGVSKSDTGKEKKQ